MNETIALTTCLAAYLSSTTLPQLRHMIFAMLCNSGRVTMLELSRWSEAGGSYRTLQRCMQTPLDWGLLLWTMVRVHLLKPEGEYVLAGDEVVVSKAGKMTHGLGRFYSSLAQRPIPGLSFLTLSLVDVQQRRSYPLRVEQRLPVKRVETIAPAPKRGRGRPKGSKNHVKAAPTLTPELSLLGGMLRTLLTWIAPLDVKHLVLDGFFGTSPPRGWYATVGCTSFTYQLTVLHKEFADPLNLVVVVKTNLHTPKCAHVLLLSTDLSLSAE